VRFFPRESASKSLALAAFGRLFQERGLPAGIRSDNGVPFASPNSLSNLSKLSVSSLRLGIAIERLNQEFLVCPSNGSDRTPRPVFHTPLTCFRLFIPFPRVSRSLLNSSLCKSSVVVRQKHWNDEAFAGKLAV
jgi:hypothetical protein